MSLKNHSFLTLLDFTRDQIHHLLDHARQLKQTRATKQPELTNKNLLLLFEKTSTRTRCAFEVAMSEEGGRVTFLEKNSSQFGKKESLEDSAKVFGRYYNAIGYRGYEQRVVEDLARYSRVPVINGLTDADHPTQILADLMTIREHVGKLLTDVKVVFVGDTRNNMACAWIYAAAKIGFHLVLYGPKELSPSDEILKKIDGLPETGAKIELSNDIDCVKDADVIYTDVWVSMGEENEMERRVELLKNYKVTKKLLEATGNPTVKFMHCLPAYHDFETTVARDAMSTHNVDIREVDDDVFRSEHSIVFDQAENRMHTIKAILIALLND